MFIFKNRISKLLLLIICTLFLLTRLYKISEIPPSVYWDEASIGYNAYSIAQTGKDEWGRSFPVHFRAFGEFKLPVYIYSTALITKFFGLNEFSVRISAVLFSLGVIILTFSLAKKLSNNESIGLLSSFFLTISPWFFIFSRTGYEATSGLFFYLLGILLMLKFFKSYIYSISSTLCFILSLYSYNSFRIITPITFIILLFLINSQGSIKKKLLYIIVSVFLFTISLVPIMRILIYDAGFGRVQSFSVFPTIKQVYDLKGNPKLQIIYNRSRDSSLHTGERFLTFFENYLSHFNPDFLLFNGDRNFRSQQSKTGQIYFLDLVLLFLGIIFILRKKNKLIFLPLALFLIGPFPASLFKESPHALRSLSIAPFICIIAAFGVQYLQKKISKIYILAVLVYVLFFGNYFGKFISGYSIKSSADWQYAYKQIYKKYSADFAKFDAIVISNQYAQPYIFALFYLQIPPKDFIKQAKYARVDDWGFSTITEIGKIKFSKVNASNLPKGKLLIFTTPIDKLDNVKEKEIIRNLDGSVGLYVYYI